MILNLLYAYGGICELYIAHKYIYIATSGSGNTQHHTSMMLISQIGNILAWEYDNGISAINGDNMHGSTTYVIQYYSGILEISMRVRLCFP